MTARTRAYPATLCALLFAGLFLAPLGGGDPTVGGAGGGINRATWDFTTPTDYVAANVSLAPGSATLEKTSSWRNYTNDAAFRNANESSSNVAILGGVRLLGDPLNRVRNGTFASGGDWTFNGTGNVSAGIDAGRAKLNHSSAAASPLVQFDSMDNVLPNWISLAFGAGSSSTLNQEFVFKDEGTGSMKDDVVIGSTVNSWAGAQRNDALSWNWSSYTHIVVRLARSTATPVNAYLNLEDQSSGTDSTPNQTVALAWNRYIFDLRPLAVDRSAVNIFQIRFTGTAGTAATVYIDDLVLFGAFNETATVEQSVPKPPTSGSPGSVTLAFDLEATAASALDAELRVDFGSFNWSESPVLAGTRALPLDASAATAGGTLTLRFSLRLARSDSGPASMAVWIDNVVLRATDYRNGTLTAFAIDAGSIATWTRAALQAATAPPTTDAFVETRTSWDNLSWTPWVPTSAGDVQSPPDRFLQWRLRLTTLLGNRTPIASRLDVAWEKHAASGEVRTLPWSPPEPLVAWRRFNASFAAPPLTTVSFEVSYNGSSWIPVVSGQNLNTTSEPIWVRASLSTGNTSVTPSVAWMSLEYEFIDVLDHIVVVPPNAFVSADGNATFTATAYDAWGHVIPTFTCTWETTDPWGSVAGNGTLEGNYSAGQVGTHRVWCFNAARTIGGYANVTVTAGALAAIRVCPDPPVTCPPTILLPVAASQPLLAEGYDSDGNPVPLAGTSWATTVGQLTPTDAAHATLAVPPTTGFGRVTAAVGLVSGGIDVVVTPQGTPRINGTVPDLVRDEDSGAYTWDLTRYAEGQPDANDTLADLKWTLTGADSSLYSVFGADTYGRHTLVVTPRPDVNGLDDVVLWLEDRSRARTGQPLQVRILPVNDAPTWRPVPEIHVAFDENYTFDFSPYVEDVDTPSDRLALTTDDPNHIVTDGLNATYLYGPPERILWVRHYASDGDAPPVPILVAIHVTPNPPPHVVRPLPDLALVEDTPASDLFPLSLREYFDDREGEQLYWSYNFTNLLVSITDDGTKVRVGVTPRPDFCGADRITFRATDPNGGFAEYTVLVSVACVNDRPVLAWADDVRVAFDRPHTLDLEPFVSDVDNARDELTLTTGDLEHAAVDRFAVTFLWTRYELGPFPSYTIPVNITLADPSDATTVRIDAIVSDNRPPELVSPLPDLRFDEDTVQADAIDLDDHFADAEDAVLTYAVTGTHVNATVALGRVTLVPALNWFGQDVLLVRATDSGGAYAIATVLVDVLPVNDAPVLLALPRQPKAGGGSWVLDLRPYVSDVDDDLAALTFETDSANVEAVGYVLVFTYPNRDYSRQVLVTVRDPGNLTDTAAVSVSVTGPSILDALLWPWSGLGALAVGALAYLGWTRLAARRYSVEDLFLVGREGRLIMHTTRRLRADRDPDILAGMLTAIMLFVRDSFKEESEDLKRFEFGDRKVAVERAEHAYAAAIFAGTVPHGMSIHLAHFLTDVEDRFGEALAKWSGDVEDLPGLREMMEDFGRRGKWRVGDWKRLAGTDEAEGRSDQ